MSRSPDSNPAEVIVGSVHDSEQHVTLPGVVTVTHARTWRVGRWYVALVAGGPQLVELVLELVRAVNNG